MTYGPFEASISAQPAATTIAVARDVAIHSGRRETRARMTKDRFRKKGAGTGGVPQKPD
jgi:hypothetical protein